MTRTGRFAVLAAALALIMLSGIATISAQGSPLQIGQSTLQLWPEYDDPGLLVIFSGTLTGTTTFPQTISLPVPAGARNIQATYQDTSGSLINRQFELADGRLTYELPSSNFHLEFYLDRQPSGDERDIRYTFEAPYQTQTLLVSVQQPARATGFALQPAAQVAEPKADGLTYHSFARSNVAAGERVEIVAKYTKTDSGLSSPQLAVTTEGAATGSAATAQAARTSNDWLPWVLIGAGTLALFGIAAYYFLSHRKPAPVVKVTSGKGTPAANARPPARSPGARPTTGVPGAVFCTQCGKPLRPEDRFCAQCGAARRN
jgi:hypothetical protein